MSVDLAALQEAAEALGEACRAADEGRIADARFALERSSLCSLTAFERFSVPGQSWAVVLGEVEEELTLDGVAVS